MPDSWPELIAAVRSPEVECVVAVAAAGNGDGGIAGIAV